MEQLKRALIVLVVLVAGAAALIGWQVGRFLGPERTLPDLHPSEFMVPSQDVEFAAIDGVPLRGWLLTGRRGAPAILLCHDLGANRAALMNLALPLRKAGYHILLFDFRAHGDSGGSRSTLGIDEALDVLGAMEFLAGQSSIDSSRIGGWGKGIGAYALVMAALDSDKLRALALDGLFPDPQFAIGESLYADAGPLREPLAWLAGKSFLWLFGPGSPHPPAASALILLGDRNLFFVVARENERQALLARELLEVVPEEADTEKNLLELEAAWSRNLYGEDRARYEDNVRKFFLRTLPPRPTPSAGKIDLLEG
ncbi:MAG: CocE/NonD family hydrolase [Acidobacteriota bacterium]